jgi:hypothetical protein
VKVIGTLTQDEASSCNEKKTGNQAHIEVIVGL